jgi:hypothetical protein
LRRELHLAVNLDAIATEDLALLYDQLVPRRPVARVVDVAPVLIVNADAAVMPVSAELAPELRLGSLADGGLLELARKWLAAGQGDHLAAACETIWSQLTQTRSVTAVQWTAELTACTRAQLSRHRTGRHPSLRAQ